MGTYPKSLPEVNDGNIHLFCASGGVCDLSRQNRQSKLRNCAQWLSNEWHMDKNFAIECDQKIPVFKIERASFNADMIRITP